MLVEIFRASDGIPYKKVTLPLITAQNLLTTCPHQPVPFIKYINYL